MLLFIAFTVSACEATAGEAEVSGDESTGHVTHIPVKSLTTLVAERLPIQDIHHLSVIHPELARVQQTFHSQSFQDLCDSFQRLLNFFPDPVPETISDYFAGNPYTMVSQCLNGYNAQLNLAAASSRNEIWLNAIKDFRLKLLCHQMVFSEEMWCPTVPDGEVGAFVSRYRHLYRVFVDNLLRNTVDPMEHHGIKHPMQCVGRHIGEPLLRAYGSEQETTSLIMDTMSNDQIVSDNAEVRGFVECGLKPLLRDFQEFKKRQEGEQR